MAEGEFHECLNLAALWQLPVLFCCENNLYAMGTALDRDRVARPTSRCKAAGYGCRRGRRRHGRRSPSSEAARRAVDAVRGGGGPHFLELRTYRFRAHSMYDPERYRDKAEVERWKERDPIAALQRAAARRPGCSTTRTWRRSRREVAAEIDDAVAFAEAGHWRAGRGPDALRLQRAGRRR